MGHFPPLAWQSCGEGCAEADIVQGLGTWSLFNVGSVLQVDNDNPTVVFRLGHGVPGAVNYYSLVRIVRSDGVTLGALQAITPQGAQVSYCPMNHVREGALTNGIMGGTAGSDESFQIFYRFSLSTGKWRWTRPEKPKSQVPEGFLVLDTDHAGGQLFTIGFGTVWGLLDFSKHEWTALEAPSLSYSGAGEGDLAVWIEKPGLAVQRIRGFAPDGAGVRTLVDAAPKTTCAVVTSPTRIVGLSASANCAGSTRLWHTPRAYDTGGVKVVLGPPISAAPFVLSSQALETWGDWASMIVFPADEYGTASGDPYQIVVRLDTWKAWRVDAPAGFLPNTDSNVVDGTHLYFTLRPVDLGGWYATRIRRIELAKLDSAPNVTPLM